MLAPPTTPLPEVRAATAPLRVLQVGSILVWPPVVLAPMAGITTSAFRRLCRESIRAGINGMPDSGEAHAAPPSAGLFVCEMVTTRALVERNAATLEMICFADDELPRSLQLYGVDPRIVAESVAMVADEDLADHIDLNFGCPVPKVTRKGGGSALPFKRRLFASIVRAAVRHAGSRPVTVKLRTGIDDEHLTYLDAGRIAQEEGAAAVALHGRTAAQMYSGAADWAAIGTLKAALSVPVLGNGDVWTAQDAVRMLQQTGADGVVVGRGCLGRPWLFAEIAAAFTGGAPPPAPSSGQIVAILRRHGQLLAAELGEQRGMRDLRKHMAWYLKGFTVGSEIRSALGQVSTSAELDDLLCRIDPYEPYPVEVAHLKRGRTTGTRRVVLPHGWLEDPEDQAVPVDAELGVSGG